VTDGLYPYFAGGKEVRLWQMARRLAAEGVAVEIYTMGWWQGGEHPSEWAGARLVALCKRRAMYQGQRRSMVQAAAFALGSLRLFRCRVDLIDADHMPYLHLPVIWLVSRVTRTPLVVTWHEWWGREYWCAYLGRLGALAAAIERAAAHLADHIVVDSPETRRRLASQGVPYGRMSLVPLGADLEAIDAAVPAPGAWDVMYAGRLLEHKGVDLLLDALGTLGEAGLRLRCLVVGSGPLEQHLREKAARLAGVKVCFVRTLARQCDVWGLMKSSRVFVYPSKREGFGLAVLEAQAAGATVVTTRHPDNLAALLVEHGRTGYLCERNSEEIARAIAFALEHPVDKETLAAHVRARSWGPRARELADVYRCVARRALAS